MDNHKKVSEWAERLGYQGTLPDSFKSICNNPATSSIWHQLLTQVKPKQEVAKIRRSNIITRLQNPDKLPSNESSYPIKELELWERKCKLRKEIDEINEDIEEKEKEANKFSNDHKIIAIKRNNLKARIKENKEKSFLLTKKSEALQKEIAEVEENLIFCRNVTPVESTEDASDVRDRLRQCSEKIKTSLLKEEIKAPICTKNSLLLTPRESSSTSIFTVSDSSIEDYSQCKQYQKEISDEVKCLEDKDLSNDVNTVLYNADSLTVFNAIINDIDMLKMKLLNIITSKNIDDRSVGQTNKMRCMMELQAKQIENELHAIKNAKEIVKIKLLLRDKENTINVTFDQIGIDRELGHIRELYHLQRKEAGLTALCNCVERQISDGKLVKGEKDELRSVEATIAKIQQTLVDELRNTNHMFELYKKMYKAMLSYREETKVLANKFNLFTSDLTWTLPLTHNLHSKEIEIFKEFPLEYNRRINTGETPLYLRDIMENLPFDPEKTDFESLHALLFLTDCPYSAPETLFYNLCQKKMKLAMQKSLVKTNAFNYKTYTMEELEKKESYITYAIEEFNGLNRQYPINSHNRDVIVMREIAKIWMELPFVDYICENRLYDGKDAKYYQNMYDKLYELIKKN